MFAPLASCLPSWSTMHDVYATCAKRCAVAMGANVLKVKGANTSDSPSYYKFQLRGCFVTADVRAVASEVINSEVLVVSLNIQLCFYELRLNARAVYVYCCARAPLEFICRKARRVEPLI